MKVLFVCRQKSGKIAPFIVEQVDSIARLGVKTDFFTIQQKGIKGYLKSRKAFLQKINNFQPDIIHAHYGLTGLFANLQRKIPVVTTYHGSDINNNKAFFFSKISIFFSKFNIFVSNKNKKKARAKSNSSLIPCGVNTELFQPKDRVECRKILGLDENTKYVLFSSSFDNQVKNPKLAKQVIRKLQNVKLLELKGYDRKQVALLMNAVDCVLMTSFTEGSPQFIKEAMACNCPIVSVNVGDVEEVVSDTVNCFVCDGYNEDSLSKKIKVILKSEPKTNGQDRIKELELSSLQIAKKIKDVYTRINNNDRSNR